MGLKQIWVDGKGELSFMRVALTPSVLACAFGIIYGAINRDPATIAASGVTLTGILYAKGQQSKYELKEQSTNTTTTNIKTINKKEI